MSSAGQDLIRDDLWKAFPLKNDLNDLWSQLHKKLSQREPSQFFNAFFSKVRISRWEKNQLFLTSHDERVINHLKRRYIDLIQKCATELARIPTFVFLETEIGIKKKEDQNIQSQEKPSMGTYSSINTNEDHATYIQLNPKYQFDQFVSGSSNEHALAAAQGIAENPNKLHNPLYIYGSVGLGKTHLLMAIGNYIQKKTPWLKVQYTPAETFQSDLMDAVQNKTFYQFKAKYRNMDILLFDDIQLISSKAEYTQEEIFHTFNYMYQNEKQIVISSDRPAQHLHTLKDRLISRFQSGLIVDIKPPNLHTRIEILRSKAKQMGLSLNEEAISHIASKIKGQVRLLEAVLIKLNFLSQCNHHQKSIDLQMIEDTLQSLCIEDGKNDLSLKVILERVSELFQVTQEQVKSRSRSSESSLARHICMYIAKNLIPSLPMHSIAVFFGRNDHSTVFHAEKKIKKLLQKDRSLQFKVQELMESLKKV